MMARKTRSPELAAYEAAAKRIRQGDDSAEAAAACAKAEAAYGAALTAAKAAKPGWYNLPIAAAMWCPPRYLQADQHLTHTEETNTMMARKKQVRTFHPLDVAASIQEQSGKVGNLLAAVQALLSLNPDFPGADILRNAADECRAAMYPDDDQ